MSAVLDKRTRLQRIVPLMVMVGVIAPQILRSRHALAQDFPRYATVLEQLCLVVLGAIAVAAVAFGVKTWRDTRGDQ